ncbi:unnamed protein product, partial [Discosporangium mesarthrocarpum]
MYIDATASARFASGFFNQNLYKWEPVLEEVPFAMALHRKEGAGREGDKNGGEEDSDNAGEAGAGKESSADSVGVMEVQVSVPEVLNLNVTEAMVSTAKKKGLALSQDQLMTTPLGMSHQPHIVRNRSGESLALTIKQQDGGEVRSNLGDGEDGVVDSQAFLRSQESLEGDLREGDSPRVGGHWGMVSAQLAEKRHSLSVAMRHRGYLYTCSSSTPIDVVGIHHIRMRRMNGRGTREAREGLFHEHTSDMGLEGPWTEEEGEPPTNLTLVGELSVGEDGSRTLTLRSQISVTNKDDNPMRLCLIRAPRRKMECTVLPGDTAYVPLHMLGPDLQVLTKPIAMSEAVRGSLDEECKTPRELSTNASGDGGMGGGLGLASNTEDWAPLFQSLAEVEAWANAKKSSAVDSKLQTLFVTGPAPQRAGPYSLVGRRGGLAADGGDIGIENMATMGWCIQADLSLGSSTGPISDNHHPPGTSPPAPGFQRSTRSQGSGVVVEGGSVHKTKGGTRGGAQQTAKGDPPEGMGKRGGASSAGSKVLYTPAFGGVLQPWYPLGSSTG